jgi:deoxyribodipyrimidine photolyase-related protein
LSGTLRYLFADHLSQRIAALTDLDPLRDVVLLTEVRAECDSVPHHPKKIALIFAAMRHFAAELTAQGVRVDYIRLDDPANTGSFGGEVERAIRRHRPERIVVTWPGEWRVLEEVRSWERRFAVPVEIREDDRFLCSLETFRHWLSGRRQPRMEAFYRMMRRHCRILLDPAGRPVGGRWNFDAENRAPLPTGVVPPEPFRVEPDAITQEVLALVRRSFPDRFGTVDGFDYPVIRAQARAALAHFVAQALPSFGRFQDAMKAGMSPLFHSRLSPLLNLGLLEPREVIDAALAAFAAGHAPLASVEGFVRQILGWREYVRGLYWSAMPGYTARNALKHMRPLPAFYWSGQTEMRCLADVITRIGREAYAHHIERLMVTGNFALLAGCDPAEVHIWYLSVFADAFEWVEAPNTLGMSQFADGGLLASKPYAASAAYLRRMSDFCEGCRFDPKLRTGERACPFNFLFWDFLARHRRRFADHPRIGALYRTFDRFPAAHQQAIRLQARAFLDSLPQARRWSKPSSIPA